MSLLRNSLAVLALAFAAGTAAQAQTPVYFLAGGGTQETSNRSQAFVVGITDPAAIARAREILAARTNNWSGTDYRLRIRIAAGADGINKNYFNPARPNWAWRATEFVGFVFMDYATGGGTTGGDFPILPDLNAECYTTSPGAISADPAGFIARNGNTVEMWGYSILAEINPTAASSAVLNLSTRGRTSSDNPMIGGIVVNAGAPKNVLIRVLGPSLTAFGVPNALDNPKVEIFTGPTKILENDNWKDSPRATEIQSMTSLRPTDDRECAILTTLFPGTYTISVTGSTGAAGTVLMEVYDLDPR
ncbi:MAG: hypothetical protein JSR82_15945 [Verrucomicrobia bacterium]|nr:hypothetical protein [Verrucomicrobiota bacterium]